MIIKDVDYFKNEREKKNPIFLSRFPNITFHNLNVLDLGCGHGALSIEIAELGAKKVVGIDINKKIIDFANDNLKNHYENFIDIISFVSNDLKYHNEKDYDIIISKAAFEHIINLEELILEIKDKLKIHGRLITGFGPLYNSPWGDHRIIKHIFPWWHVILPQKCLINRINKSRTHKIESIHDLGLNGLSLKQYRNILLNTKGFKPIYFRTNVTNGYFRTKVINGLLGKLINIFTYIPVFKEYLTFNIYCILERTE